MTTQQSTKRSFEERFWSRVRRADGDACWEWTAARFPKGYGKVALTSGRRKTDGAHRIAWILTNGPIPDGLWVLHKCDYRPCCRPDHLFLGTAKDNTLDMIAKGRSRYRVGVWRAPQVYRPSPRRKFTPQDVQSMRVRAEAGEPLAALARDVGASRSQIRLIVSRATYRDVA